MNDDDDRTGFLCIMLACITIYLLRWKLEEIGNNIPTCAYKLHMHFRPEKKFIQITLKGMLFRNSGRPRAFVWVRLNFCSSLLTFFTLKIQNKKMYFILNRHNFFPYLDLLPNWRVFPLSLPNLGDHQFYIIKTTKIHFL